LTASRARGIFAIMAIPQELLFTREDYCALPDAGPRYQLVEGDLLVAPAPNRYHQDISRNLQFILCSYLKEHPIGKLYNAPFDVYLDDINVFQPDILVVSNTRRSILVPAGAEGAPDLAVEILSPSNAALDREKKRKVYARCGVIELWILSPESRTLQVYRLQEDPATPVLIRGEHETIETSLLPGLKVDLREVFAE